MPRVRENAYQHRPANHEKFTLSSANSRDTAASWKLLCPVVPDRTGHSIVKQFGL